MHITLNFVSINVHYIVNFEGYIEVLHLDGDPQIIFTICTSTVKGGKGFNEFFAMSSLPPLQICP